MTKIYSRDSKVTVLKNIISLEEIQTFLDFMTVEDEYYDDRELAFSKSVSFDKSNWPRETFLNVISRVCKNVEFEVINFYTQKTTKFGGFGIHTDTSDGNQGVLFKNILIPLQVSDDSYTAIFKNRWYGPRAKFGYTPKNISDTVVINSDDYYKLEYYNKDAIFDTEIHKKFLKHIDYSQLNGLILDTIYKWELGDIVLYDRQQLHSSCYSELPKTGITVFTNRASMKQTKS